MKYLLLGAAALAVAMLSASSARADSLLYSFENGDSPNNLDGFANNGGGITVTQDTIGATVGTGSMKNVTVAGATFTGALTGTVPAALNDPSVSAIKLDYTVNAGDAFTGAFADIGITIFGAINGTFGNQYQVDASSEQNISLAPGTHTLTIPLIGTSPVSFNLHETYGTVLGEGFIPTGVEFFYSKSGDAPVTGYIDNVIAVTPEPASFALLAVGGLLAGSRRRRH